MTITVRVDKELEKTIEQFATQEGLSKSAYIRQCVEKAIEEKRRVQSPWQLGKNKFGIFSSGRGDLSINRKDIIRDKINAKRRSD